MAAKTKPVLLVFDQMNYATPYREIFDVQYANTREDLVKGVMNCDVVLFTGGSDIGPHLYNEPAGSRTSTNPHRDKFEQFVWNLARQEKKGVLGICRGLQFIHAMNGGKLIQHTTGHMGGHHLIEDVFGNSLLMTSVHHQMVRPETVPRSTVIAWNKTPSSATYLDGWDKEIYTPKDGEALPSFQEAEIVWYPDTNALGIQGHPEMSENRNLHSYCRSLVQYYLLGEKAELPKYVNVAV